MALDKPAAQGTFTNADIDTSEIVIEAVNVRDQKVMWVSFLVGTADLTAFTVEYQVHSEGDFVSIASATADYTTPEGPILGASGDLTLAASGSTVHWLKLNVEGVESVRFKAAGTSSTITGNWKAA